jgi:hypothetical protein
MPDNTTTPPDWVLLEAAKRCGWTPDLTWLRADYRAVNGSFRALCDMIERYEQPPVDRKVLCAREAMIGCLVPMSVENAESAIIRAIELWEEGFGK